MTWAPPNTSQVDFNICVTHSKHCVYLFCQIIIDSRKNNTEPKPSIIHSKDVAIVDNYKYLGTLFDSQPKFDVNTDTIVKRGQRIHLLRKLNSFNVCNTVLCVFHQSFIESLLTLSFICWYNGLSVKDRNSLNNTVKVCSEIIRVQRERETSLWEKRMVQKAKE